MTKTPPLNTVQCTSDEGTGSGCYEKDVLCTSDDGIGNGCILKVV